MDIHEAPSTIAPGDCDCCCAKGGQAADERVRRQVEECGWAVVGMTDPNKPFAHTVGLTARGLPELLTGVPVPALLERAGGYLEAAVERHLEAELKPGDSFTAGGRDWTVHAMEGPDRLWKLRQFYPEPRVLLLRRF